MKFNMGDEVYWNDPDDNISSGYYNIVNILGKDMYYIKNAHSEAEVFEHELE